MNELDLPLRSLALYNPHLLSRDELLALFAAREDLLSELVSDLRATPLEEPAQHHLVIGQRGMGKTMLLRRLQVAVEDDPELGDTWLPLSFPEEQYNVVTLSDFWLNCVDALSDRLEAGERFPDAVEALDRAVEEIRNVQDETHRAERALDALVGTAESLGRRLLLLVDNADLILDRIGEQDWALREVLSSRSKVTLIGASAAMLESTYEYGRAFYDFFKVHELAGLSVEETKRLLLRYAEAQDNAHVKQVVEAEPARLRVLHTLTGGNPRTLVLLFNIFAHGADGDVRADLEQLLDQCTPLYKARFEALPAQAQQVVDALALHWDPVSAGELAETLRMKVNQVSAQLNRLTQMGVVEKVPYEPDSKTGFQIGERFFNIWYLMRASRRVRRRLIWLVKFLRLCYDQDELRDQVKQHLRLTKQFPLNDRLRHVEYSFALASTIEDINLKIALERTALHTLAGLGGTELDLQGIMKFEGVDDDFVSRAQYVALQENMKRLVAQLPDDLYDLPINFHDILLHSPVDPALKAALAATLGGLVDVPEDTRAEALTVARDLVKMYGQLSRLLEMPFLAQIPVRSALENGYLLALDDMDGARLAEESMGSTGIVEVVTAIKALTSSDKTGPVPVEELLPYAKTPILFLVLFLDIGNSSIPLNELVERFLAQQQAPTQALAGIAVGLDKVGRSEQAEAILRKSVELDCNDESQNALAWHLFRRGGNLLEAERLARNALESGSNADVQLTLACILVRNSRWKEAAALTSNFLQAWTVEGPESLWPKILTFFSEAVAQNQARAATDLLDELDLDERWRPLREALEAIARDSDTYLRRVAPEVREPAEAILKELREPVGAS